MPETYNLRSRYTSTLEPKIKEPFSAHSHKVRSLTCNIFLWNSINWLPFNDLKSCEINIEPDVAQRSTANQIANAVYAPSLRSLYVSVCMPPYNTLQIIPGFPWAQLRDLTIHGIEPLVDILNLLVQCPSLGVFAIHSRIADPGDISTPTTPVYLPHLESLSFDLASAVSVRILSLLQLPSLSFFCFNMLPSVDEILLPYFSNFIHFVAGTLRCFEVSDISSIVTSVKEVEDKIISILSPITHLILHKGHSFSRSALLGIRNGSLLPNLKHGEFTLTSASKAHMLVDMLSARRGYGLKKVVIPLMSRGRFK
ncbi:hypothetical protein BDZ94DRAFT_1309372 [Collybia nuda]|uniref:Uncharacterized protein n=1 Tax=Collybia nuda TaxID=64659 RepID=A0A9P5Y6Z8_9AGAR|nr:hypothetical protein BDZ94DRAFT_1309372 [Collybia nuda]